MAGLFLKRAIFIRNSDGQILLSFSVTVGTCSQARDECLVFIKLQRRSLHVLACKKISSREDDCREDNGDADC